MKNSKFIKRCEEMRIRSGNISFWDDKLTLFIYTLCRDHLPVGVVEGIVDELENCDKKVLFTNGWLAEYSSDVSKRLK